MNIEILRALQELHDSIDEGLEPELADSVREAILDTLATLNWFAILFLKVYIYAPFSNH